MEIARNPLINCKIDLKLRWTKHFVLSVASTDKANGNNDKNFVIFTIKGSKLYVLVVTLSARDNQNYENFLAKYLKDQFIRMNI